LPDGTSVELGHWWIKFSANGQTFRESSKSDRYAVAERLLKQRIGEVVTGAFHGLEIEKMTVAALLDDVLLDYESNGKAVRFARPPSNITCGPISVGAARLRSPRRRSRNTLPTGGVTPRARARIAAA
jgi:hypothetical protein